MTKPGIKLAILLVFVIFLIFSVFRFVVHSEETPPAKQEEPAAPEVRSPGAGKPAAGKGSAGVHGAGQAGAGEGEGEEEATPVAPPPFTPGIFPCSGCHDDLESNTTQRALKRKHTEIQLHHDEKNRWCLDCHTAGNLDHLHLASGKLVEFSESYKLCGQCHGPTLRNWKAGEHGKRTGSWSGKKQYLLCVNCHSPHSPHFKPLKPLPPPIRPKDLR